MNVDPAAATVRSKGLAPRILGGAILVAVIAILASYFKDFSGTPKELNLRVSYPFFESVRTVDTSSILNLNQYNLAHNLFSRLVTYNSDYQLVPGISDSYSIVNGEVVFTFGNRATTIDGHLIGAEDAAVSLKRLVVLGRSGHGDIRRLLCPNEKLESVKQACSGIRVEENQLFLKPVKPHYIPFLISVLESADYGVIPKSSLSKDGLKIIDYRNTSGPYFVDQDSNVGAFTLKANPGHYQYHAQMPQTVTFVPTPLTQGPAQLVAGAVDLVTTSEYYTGAKADEVLSKGSKYSKFSSQPFRVDIVCFSDEAIKNFSVAQRFAAAKEVARVKTSIFPTPGMQPAIQFFQSLSDGSLSADQKVEIQKLRDEKAIEFKSPLILGVHKRFLEFYAGKFDDKQVKPVGFEKPLFDYPPAKRSHMYNVATDSAWTENLSLLGHNFETGVFHLPGLNADKWFTDYLETESKEERIRKLNKLHFDLLSNAAIVPYSAYPYNAVASPDWTLNFSTFASTTDLWRMRSN